MHLGKTSVKDFHSKRDADGKHIITSLTLPHGDNEDLRSFPFY
jgi:hypothetical protein